MEEFTSSHEFKLNLITALFREYLGNLTQQSHTALWEEYAELCTAHAGSVNRRYTYDRKPTATTFTSGMQCDRRTWWAARLTEETNPPDWRGHHIFEHGYIEECWLKALLNVTGVEYQDHQGYELPWEHPKWGRIYVGPDGVELPTKPWANNLSEAFGTYPPEIAILEIKSISDHGFDDVRKDGLQSAKPGYYQQVQLGLLGTGGDLAVIILINKNTSALHEIWITRDDECITRLDALFLSTYRSELPGRTYGVEAYGTKHRGKADPRTNGKANDPSAVFVQLFNKNGTPYAWQEIEGYELSWQCRYCGYRDLCWGNEYNITEVYAGSRPMVSLTRKEPVSED